MSVLHTLYYYRHTVKRLTMRFQRVRQGRSFGSSVLASDGSLPFGSGGGFSG